MQRILLLSLSMLLMAPAFPARGQSSSVYAILSRTQVARLTDTLTTVLQDGMRQMTDLRIINAGVNDPAKTLTITFNSALAEYPMRASTVGLIEQVVRSLLSAPYNTYTVTVRTDGKSLQELIPVYFGGKGALTDNAQKAENQATYRNRTALPKTAEEVKKKRRSKRTSPVEEQYLTHAERHTKRINDDKRQQLDVMAYTLQERRAHTWAALGPTPLVTRTDKPFNITNGLNSKHIALWQSHGWYYEQKLLRWEWQRARLFQTVEDLYTMSYVQPFLLPMLENAGAVVLLPRERDLQTHEVVVDNDSPNAAPQAEGAWQTTAGGFAHAKRVYTGFDNPFSMGTFQQVATYNPENPSNTSPAQIEWRPDIPESGAYAVTVSYKTVPLSARDAQYTVYHKGGATHFLVNQQMGGGTWIYLGTFLFDAGRQEQGRVVLTNQSQEYDAVVTADAVRFGGGMGNVGRYPQDTLLMEQHKDVAFEPLVSGYPRFAEGSRYYLQWAGFADSVFTYYEGMNDYTDDYTSRGRWVNTLAGGSDRHPDNPGLYIPIDLSFGFHSDAGTALGDSIIGTLGIYTRTCDGMEILPTGASRATSRDLTDLVQTQVVEDIRAQFNPAWSRRGIWNKSYAESRVPQVPAMLLELLSHQNFADMRYGLDPAFRFAVSRAVYKGILRYLSSTQGFEYVVQPLPVQDFAVLFDTPANTTGASTTYTASLSWTPTPDPLEPTARAERYVLYTRKGNDTQAFDNGVVVEGTSTTLSLETGVPYSFKVTAVNAGGESFPSEILSICKVPQEKGKVLVVNGFTRISAPDSYLSSDSLLGGFVDSRDHGVPYLYDLSYVGSQYEFRRTLPWVDDDAPGFGSSYADYETVVLPGNTFDYPLVHGLAVVQAGYSYASCSASAFAQVPTSTRGTWASQGYGTIDVILGKQKQIRRGGDTLRPVECAAYPVAVQDQLMACAQAGLHLLVSGAYVGSDLWEGLNPDVAGMYFAQNILKFVWRTGNASKSGQLTAAPSPYTSFYSPNAPAKYDFDTQLNTSVYPVESPDAIEPVGAGSYTLLRYADSQFSAAVGYKGSDYASVVMGFPLETLRTPEQRAQWMEACLRFFEE